MNCRTINEIQLVWHLFQTAKNMDTHRLNLGNVMKEWATRMSVEIDDSVYFNKSTIKDIVNLRFNPGSCLATFKSVEKEISFLACTPRTEDETEETHRRDDTEIRSEENQNMEESLALSATDPKAPPSDFDELKLCFGTFYALTWDLFGDYCSYYQKLFSMRKLVDQGPVKAI